MRENPFNNCDLRVNYWLLVIHREEAEDGIAALLVKLDTFVSPILTCSRSLTELPSSIDCSAQSRSLARRFFPRPCPSLLPAPMMTPDWEGNAPRSAVLNLSWELEKWTTCTPLTFYMYLFSSAFCFSALTICNLQEMKIWTMCIHTTQKKTRRMSMAYILNAKSPPPPIDSWKGQICQVVCILSLTSRFLAYSLPT